MGAAAILFLVVLLVAPPRASRPCDGTRSPTPATAPPSPAAINGKDTAHLFIFWLFHSLYSLIKGHTARSIFRSALVAAVSLACPRLALVDTSPVRIHRDVSLPTFLSDAPEQPTEAVQHLNEVSNQRALILNPSGAHLWKHGMRWKTNRYPHHSCFSIRMCCSLFQ